jgi:hypothetical protein
MKNDKTYIVYIITCNNDEYRYIGITCQTLERRFDQHKRSKARIGNYIRKYKDAKINILYSNLSKEEAYQKEYDLVPKTQELREQNNFLNLVQGGKIIERVLSEDVEERKRKKISDTIKKKLSEDIEYRTKIVEKITSWNKRIEARKQFELVDINGKIWTHNDCSLAELCYRHNIAQTNMSKLLQEKIFYLKGFRLKKYENYIPIQDTEFCLKSPTGEIIYGKNLQKFCRENDLCYTYVRRMIKGSKGEGNQIYKNYKSHKGWTVFSGVGEP